MAGRPTKYSAEYPAIARKLVKLGATEQDLADFFEVNRDTIAEWKKVHQEFSETIKEAKDEKDAQVERSLYERATGYRRKIERLNKAGDPVECVEEIPPDVTAQIFWLKNRQPKRWRDKQEHEHSGSVVINIDTQPKEVK